MSKFTKYKLLKDGRQIRGRYNCDTDKILISREDFEGLLNEADVAYEQAQQLQTIIENLQDIKAGAVTKALDEIRAEIEEYRDSMRWSSESLVKWEAINYVLEHIIDKHRSGSEVEE